MVALRPVAYEPYGDPEEFIVEWTDRIWVQRGIGLIRQNYADEAIVHGAYGTTTGVQGVIDGTLMKIAAFPDRVGQAEDVVWEARGDDGFLSSHRVLSCGTHTGTSLYGPPTHRPFTSRTIANCLYVRGQMVREWVVRDEYAVVTQLGLDPEAIARKLAFSDWQGGPSEPPPPDPIASGESGPRPRAHHQDGGGPKDHDRPHEQDGGGHQNHDHAAEVEVACSFIEEVWGGLRFDRISEYAHRDVVCHTVGHRDVVRPDGYQRTILDLLAPFPGARVEIRDIAANESVAHGGVRVAVLWVLRGDHRGIPVYGPITGSPVKILGASQFLIRNGRIVTEWRIYDKLSILTQVAQARGDEPGAGDPR